MELSVLHSSSVTFAEKLLVVPNDTSAIPKYSKFVAASTHLSQHVSFFILICPMKIKNGVCYKLFIYKQLYIKAFLCFTNDNIE